MGKHSRQVGRHARPYEPPPPAVDPADQLAAFKWRRQAKAGIWRTYHAGDGRGSHVNLTGTQLLVKWDGFKFEPAGTALNRAAAQPHDPPDCVRRPACFHPATQS
jgi:hypothetical protein